MMLFQSTIFTIALAQQPDSASAHADQSHLLCQGADGCTGVWLDQIGECVCGTGIITGFFQEFQDDECLIPRDRWDSEENHEDMPSRRLDPPSDCSEQGFDFGTWCDFEDFCADAYMTAGVFLGTETQRDGFPCPDGSAAFDLDFDGVHPRECCSCAGTFCALPDGIPSGSGTVDPPLNPPTDCSEQGFDFGAWCDFEDFCADAYAAAGVFLGTETQRDGFPCPDGSAPFDLDFDGVHPRDCCSCAGTFCAINSGEGSGDIYGSGTSINSGMGSGDNSGSGSGSGSGGFGSGMISGKEPFMFPTGACIGEGISESFTVTCAGMNEIKRTLFSDANCGTEMRTEYYRNNECSTVDEEAYQLDSWTSTESQWSGGVVRLNVYQDTSKPDNKLAFCFEASGLPAGTQANPNPTRMSCRLDDWSWGHDWLIEGSDWHSTNLETYTACAEINSIHDKAGYVICEAMYSNFDPDTGNGEGGNVHGYYEWQLRQQFITVSWDGAEFCGGVGHKCTTAGCPTGGVWNSDGECVCGTVLETFVKYFEPETCDGDEVKAERKFHVMEECVKRESFATKATCNNGELVVEYHTDMLCQGTIASIARRLDPVAQLGAGVCTFTNDDCDTSCEYELFGGYEAFKLSWFADDICGPGAPTPEPTGFPTAAPTKCMSSDAVSWNGHCHVAGDPHIYGFDNAYGTVLRDGDFLLYEDEGISVSFRSAIHEGYYNAAGVNAMYVTGSSIGDLEIEVYAKTEYNNLFPTYEVYLDGVRTTMAEMCDEISKYACQCSFVDTAPSWENFADGENLSRFTLHVDQDTMITWWGGNVEYGWASIHVDKIQGSPFGARGICTMSAVQGTDPFVDPYPDQMYDCNTSPLHKYRTNYCGDRRRSGGNTMADLLSECQTNEPAKHAEAVTICTPCAGQANGGDSCVFDGCAEGLDAAREFARSCHQVDVARTPPAQRAVLCEDPTPVYSEDLGTCVAAWEDDATATSTASNPIITPEPTANPTAEPTADPTAEPTADPTAEPTADPTAEPTADPTAEPTADPTAEPTADPTNPAVATPTPTVATPAPTNDELHEEQAELLAELLKEVKELRQQEGQRAESGTNGGDSSTLETLSAYTSLVTLVAVLGFAGFAAQKAFCGKPASANAQSVEMPNRPPSPSAMEGALSTKM